MDTRKGFLNVFISIISQALMLVFSIITRRLIIDNLGNTINGLTSLYASVIGVLSVTELGIGSAIIYCMYEPIARNDEVAVSALYNLFKKIYIIVGLVIFAGGLVVTPFLKFLVKDYAQLDVNFTLTFILSLIASVLSYTYSAKTALINAYRYNYITTSVGSILTIFTHFLEIAVILATHSFILYLLCSIFMHLIHYTILTVFAEKKFPKLLRTDNKIDKATSLEVSKNVKAMFMHKIGDTLVNTIDSMIISAFIGVVVLGKYSNYIVIITAMVSVIYLFFSPLSSVIGQVYVQESKDEIHTYFQFFHTFNFVIGVFFFLGYYAIADQLIALFFGENLLIAKSISFTATLSYFIQFMRQSPVLFRNATGAFYYDRFRPLAEGVSNAVLSIIFVKIFPENLGIVGVLAATIITNILICDTIEPYVIYKYAFEKKPSGFYVKNYSFILIFAVLLFFESTLNIHSANIYLDILINGSIAVGIGLIVFLISFAFDKTFRIYTKKILSKMAKRI